MTKNLKKQPQSLKIPKLIIATVQFLSIISSKWTTLFIAKLFTTPLKHKIPKREIEMYATSKQKLMLIPLINKKVNVYQYGEASKKILLVHGWSGRGTQLVKFADELIKNDFSIISFDAPAHGKSPGNTTIMIEFIESILELDRKFGPFEAAIGHSLGGISLLNAVKEKLKLNCLITIGSADIINDIMVDFAIKLKLKQKYSELLKVHFEKKYQREMNSFSAHLSARKTDIPVLIIHDENDDEVLVKNAHQIYQNLKNGHLMITKNLGHRKILGDYNVIQRSLNFINENQYA